MTTGRAQVRVTRLAVPGASLGPEDRLPHLQPVRALPEPRLDPAATSEMRARVRYGRPATELPYARFSDYDRTTEPRSLPAYELDNGLLTATVLPGLGGRVWSLRDRVRDRELLHRNPILRFANLGLTDAWFAGGIEWNLGSTGHGCLTTRPLHAGVLHLPDGDVLRLWEWERSRDLVLQVDLTLDGPRLVASIRIINPDPVDKPLYYWTNVAVPETAGTRVLCPATHAWRTSYDGALDRVAVPRPDPAAPDASRPGTVPDAADYFYEVADSAGRVVAAVEPDGVGLAQASTSGLTGRKLFLWGTGPGGARWQEWLSGPDSRYCEIQAGVCPTQLEHDRLAAGATRSWTETFGTVELDPAVAADDYPAAAAAVREAVHRTESPDRLEERHARWLAEVADRRPDEVVATGSGWGCVELTLRGGSWEYAEALPFPEVDDASAVAMAVVRDEGEARLDATAPDLPVPPVSDRWVELLGRRGRHWWLEQARAVNHHLRGELDEAERCYRRAIASRPSAVAERGLALVARARGRDQDAVDHYEAATRLDSSSRSLATEQLELLLELGRPRDALAVEAELPPGVRRHGRTRLLRARALVATGSTTEAAGIVDDLEVADLAEGTRDLDRIWAEVRPGAPLPPRLDFRMVREVGTR